MTQHTAVRLTADEVADGVSYIRAFSDIYRRIGLIDVAERTAKVADILERLEAEAASMRKALEGGRHKLATYASVYPDDKELRALLGQWDAALSLSPASEARR